MIRVTIEVVPFGVEEDASVIRTVHIANVSEPQDHPARYQVWLNCTPSTFPEPDATITHVREHGAMVLVERALEALTKAGFQ